MKIEYVSVDCLKVEYRTDALVVKSIVLWMIVSLNTQVFILIKRINISTLLREIPLILENH